MLRPWPARICAWRYSVEPQANFAAAIQATRAVEAMPLSIRLAGPARVFGTDEPKNPQDRGNLIEHLADILADAMERAGAARTRCRLRLDRHVAARKMLGQGPDIAVPLVPRSRSGLGLVVVVGGRRQGGVRLGIAQT